MHPRQLAFIICALAAASGCGGGTAPATPTATVALQPAATASLSGGTGASVAPAGSATPSVGNARGVPVLTGEVHQTSSGLRYIDEAVGTGAAPATGQMVTVQYTGWLTNGQKFDSSRDHGQPFSFVIGRGSVIAGWDEGVATMKVGGKRRLIVPPTLGYGARGAPPVIPPNATLLFDVELLSVK